MTTESIRFYSCNVFQISLLTAISIIFQAKYSVRASNDMVAQDRSTKWAIMYRRKVQPTKSIDLMNEIISMFLLEWEILKGMYLYNWLLPSQMQNTWQDSSQHRCTQWPAQSWQNSLGRECSLQIRGLVEGQTFQLDGDQAQRQRQESLRASVQRWWGIMWTRQTAWWKMRSLRSRTLDR